MVKELRKWREDRRLTQSNYKAYFTNIIEELLEPIYKDPDVLRAAKQTIVDIYYKDNIELDEHDIIDTINDITVFSVNETELMGYSFDKTMSETIKEISSREGEYNPESGKWEKFKTKRAIKKWYKADYSKCKMD